MVRVWLCCVRGRYCPSWLRGMHKHGNMILSWKGPSRKNEWSLVYKPQFSLGSYQCGIALSNTSPHQRWVVHTRDQVWICHRQHKMMWSDMVAAPISHCLLWLKGAWAYTTLSQKRLSREREVFYLQGTALPWLTSVGLSLKPPQLRALHTGDLEYDFYTWCHLMWSKFGNIPHEILSTLA